MRLSLEALETLDAIAEQGSFAKAADVLHRVPSALTYTIKKLESDLEVMLFDRSGQRAKLTEVGERLLAEGRQLLRDAEALEQRIRRRAEGWETRLTIAVEELVPIEALFPIIAEFDQLQCGTQLRLTQEAVGHGWQALVDRRAEVAVGVTGDSPSPFDFDSCELGAAQFVFAMAPSHPLAQANEPIPAHELARHRMIIAANADRRLPLRNSAASPDQSVLVVPSMAAKLAAQTAGLGVGFVPLHLAAELLRTRRLIVKEVSLVSSPGACRLAWHSGNEGRALTWLRQRLQEPDLVEAIFANSPPLPSRAMVLDVAEACP